MRRGKSLPPWRSRVSAIASLRWLQPKNTAKWLQAELGCSPRQSHRILYEGRVARNLRARLIDLLEASIASNEEHLRQLRRELKDWEDGRSSRGIAPEYPLARVVGPDAETLPGFPNRTKKSPLE